MKIRLEKELKKITLIYVISYLSLYAVMILSSYFLSYKYYEKLAENTTNLAANSILSNDKRQILFYLNTATLNFRAVIFIDNTGIVQFKLPTDFIPEQKNLFLIALKNSITTEGIQAEDSGPSINYYYDFFKVILFVTGVWLLLTLFYIPLFFFSKRSLEKKYQESLVVNQLKFSNQLARQVAHDIRSPLTALNMVMGAVKELPEEKRVLIRNAVQRINDIANNLLVKSKTPTASSTDHGINTGHTNTTSHKKTSHTNNLKLDTHLLSSLIDTIVSEKRIQFRDKINVHIEADLNEAYGLFARIDSQEFQRVISNLINNSVEALLDAKGEVTVSIRGYTNTILVVVFDNGKGIPQQLLAKLGEVGVSYGKEGTESGSGLGLAHAKKAIESFGGKFEIQSRVGEGTMVNITLTREQTPKWFVEEIRLSSNMQLVSVDDDVSIHQVWSGRFKSLHISEIIKHMSFTSIKSFMEWFARQATENNIGISNILFLVDYEFLNESMTGLDLIEKLNISKYAILITSRFDEPQIRVRCDSVGIKLIPKSMAGLVPIKVKPMLKREQKQLLNIILPDAILIDDDMLVHMTWNSFAKENNKKYAQYFSVEEFLKAQSLYDHTSPIFVDSNLGNNIKGEDAAKEIFKQGFKNIFIATGYEASSIVVHPWIKGVVGKDPQ